MKFSRFWLLVLIFLVFTTSIALAFYENRIACQTGHPNCSDECDELQENCTCGPGNICYSTDELNSINNPSRANNTSVVRNNTADNPVVNNVVVTSTNLTLNQTFLLQLQSKVQLLEAKSLSLEQQFASISATLTSLQQQMNQINTDVTEKLTLDSQQIEEISSTLNSITSQQNMISTGLAGLQQGLLSTQTDVKKLEDDVIQKQQRTQLIMYILLALAVVGIAVGVIYYITKGKASSNSEEEANPEILNYITSHIKKGKKYSQIKENLAKAGWSEEDIATAYKETMKRNYAKYKNSGSVSFSSSSGKSSPPLDRNKMISIAIVSLLLIIGVFFLIRGISMGQAIAFQSQQELDAAVKGLLKTYVDNSEFYPLVKSASICVEVHDRDKVVSYRIIKTPKAHAIGQAPMVCSGDPDYDFALRFNTWDSFNIVMRRMTCDSFQRQHGAKGFYALPSRYILPGFKLNPDKDPAEFCPALLKCLTPTELDQMGIVC